MKKLKITFDQLFQSVIYQNILNQGIPDDKIKPVLDASAFQNEDMLEGFSLIMIKSYGGNRMAIEDIDATPMSIQIIVNTDEPQTWKRVLTSMGDQLNGKWNSVEWPEDEHYLNSFYHYFPALHLPMVVGGEQQVGTSTRYTITMTGTVFFTSHSNLAPIVPIKIYDEDTEEYLSIKYLLNSNFGYTQQTEAFQSKEKVNLENETKGMSRVVSGSFIFDKNCSAHKKLMRTFFQKSINPIKIKIYIDESDSEFSTTMDVIINELTNSHITGNSISTRFSLIESSD